MVTIFIPVMTSECFDHVFGRISYKGYRDEIGEYLFCRPGRILKNNNCFLTYSKIVALNQKEASKHNLTSLVEFLFDYHLHETRHVEK